MKRFHAPRILAAAVLSFLLLAANKGEAILPSSLWQDVGPAPGGGRLILGSGALDVGQLDAFSTANTSLAGNYVTLNLGSTATGNSSATVQFTTAGNTLLNNGTIIAPSFDFPSIPFINTGVAYYSNNIVTNNALINNGIINGGQGSNESNAWITNAGVGFAGFDGILNIGVTNTNTIQGGAGGNGGSWYSVGDGVIIFDDNGYDDEINGVNVFNSGKISGGGNSINAVSVDNGVAVVGFGDVKNINFTNTATGVITGGSRNSNNEGNSNGFFTGNGVVFGAGVTHNFRNNNSRSSLSTVNFSNAGSITGGNNNINSDANLNPNGNAAGSGAVFWGSNGVYNITFNNSGSIIGGNDNSGYGNGESGGFGSAVGTAAGIFDANNSLSNPEDIIGVTAVNSGILTGGNSAQQAAMVSTGFGIVGYGNVKNIFFTNTATGVITGGNNSNGGGEASSFAGTGLGVSAGFNFFKFNNSYTLDNVSIVNNGRIVGGNNNANAWAVGTGVALLGGNGVTNAMLTNNGIILGGDNNHSGDFLGTGVLVYDPSNFNNREIKNITITNNNLIAGGKNNQSGAEGIAVIGDGDVSNVTIHNEGTVLGGDGGNGDGAASGGDAVRIFASGASSNIIIANCGMLIGGNATSGGTAGKGINTSANGVTVYNWGVVSSGKDSGGNFQTGIYINGNNNTVNLNGHSSVYGKITGVGTNNVLNLNFTGVPIAQKAALLSSLTTQGVFNAVPPASYSFTLRGVTYTVDPFTTHFNIASYEEQGQTPNQKAIGKSLDSIKVNPTGDLLELYNAIDGGCGARNPTSQALDSLSPISYQIFGTQAISTMNFLTLEIDTRLNNLRDGSESIDTSGLGISSFTVADMVAESSSDSSKDGGKNSTPIIPESKQKKWGFFATGNVVFGREDAHDDVPDSKFTNAGLIMGVDGRINEHLVTGLLFNYGHTSATTDNLGSTATADTVGGGLYTGYRDGGLYGNGLLTYARNSYDTSRNIVLSTLSRTASGKTDGDQYGINIDGGYDHHVNNNLTFGPLAGLQYVNVGVDGFNETGAGAANLSVSRQEVNSLRSRVGFRMDYHKALSNEVVFAAEARAAWQHEYLDDSRAITSSFIGSGLTPFSVKTANPERDAALVGVGIDTTFRNTMTIYGDLDVQVGQAHYYEYSVRGGIKFSF